MLINSIEISDLELLTVDTIDSNVLKDNGLVKYSMRPIKVLGNGELTKKLNVTANSFSTSAKEKIEKILLDTMPIQSLEQDLEILTKALECYKADIEKAENTGVEYFVKLLGNVQEARKDLEPINDALIKIKQYSD